MKALSIKQPWASLIAHGIKDIENRTWKTNFRGKIFIHATGVSAGHFTHVLSESQLDVIYKKTDFRFLDTTLIKSAIIGEIDIIDCVINHPSIWAEKTEYEQVGPYLTYKNDKPIYNWVLSNPVLYDKPILKVKGKLSFWEFENKKLYFRTIDDNTCHSLEYHMDDARNEELEEITLVEAIPDNDNPDYVWCTHYENIEEKNQCKKSFCPAYESVSGRGVCQYRGNLYTFGEEVTFKID